jgi:hypothetical protein
MSVMDQAIAEELEWLDSLRALTCHGRDGVRRRDDEIAEAKDIASRSEREQSAVKPLGDGSFGRADNRQTRTPLAR